MKKYLFGWAFSIRPTKTNLKMKLTTLLLIVSVFEIHANFTYSQNTKLTLELEDVTIEHVFNQIESVSEFRFLFESQEIDLDRKVSINVNRKNIRYILNLLFKNTDIDYKTLNRQILLTKKKSQTTTNEGVDKEITAVKEETTVQLSISGNVVDSEGEPLPGANVVEKGTTNGTLTDSDGNFTLKVADENAVLVISYIGFTTQEIPLNGRVNVSITLETSISALEELVVIGYGQVSKKELTGSVSNVDAEALENLPVSRVDQVLAGRAAGVQVTSINGAPGQRSSIRIRGGNSINANNEPLYVLDGFVVGTNFDLNALNVNDIESIDILKDATAISVYGAQGSNGVVLITTKSGKGLSEGQSEITVNAYSGQQNFVRKIDVLNGRDLAEYQNEGAIIRNIPLPFPDLDAVTTTDWQEEIAQTGLIHNVDASLSGNTEDLNYYTSLNYFNQTGIIKNSGLDRVVFRANLDKKASEKISVGTRLNLSRSRAENNKTNFFTVLKEAFTAMPVFDENGEYSDLHPVTLDIFNNPVQIVNEVEDHQFNTGILGSVYLDYRPINGLTFRSTFGPDIRITKRNRYRPGTLPERAASNQGGFATINNSSFISLLNENTLTYKGNIGDNHNFDAFVGFTWQTTQQETSFSQGQGYTNDALSFNNMGTGNPEQNRLGSNFVERSIVSWPARINYNYRYKYLFTIAGRVDGSSVFTEGNKYAFFPSVSVAWNIIEEPFMWDLTAFTNLKLRASYGEAGSQAIGPYQTLSRLNTMNAFFGTSQTLGVVKGRPPSDLRWETTEQLDISLEAGFFGDRLNMEVGYYNKKTRDLLLGVSISPITGFGNQLANFGAIRNKGLELTLSSVNIDNGSFKWTSNLAISGNRSEVLDIGAAPFLGGVQGRITVGEPVGLFKGLEYIGTVQNQSDLDNPPADWFLPGNAQLGFPVFRDLDESGGLSVDDYVTLGDPEPDFFGGFNNTFSYKGFTLDVFLQFSQGNDIFWRDMAWRGFFGDHASNIFVSALNRWSPENPTSNVPRAGTHSFVAASTSNSQFVFDGSFLRLRTVRLAYDIPFDKIKGIKGLNLYVIGDNLAILTDYIGYDPEVNVPPGGSTSVVRGQDSATYPRNRGFTLGLNMKF